MRKNQVVVTYRGSFSRIQVLRFADAVSGGDEHGSRRDYALKLALEQRQPMHIKEEGLRTTVRLERGRIRDQRQHSCGVDDRVRRGLASQQAVEAHSLGSDLASEAPSDPGPRSLQG